MANPNRSTAGWRSSLAGPPTLPDSKVSKEKRPATVEMPIELARLLMLRLDASRALLARLPAMYSTAEMVALDAERTSHSQFFEMFFHCTDLSKDAQDAADHMRRLSDDIGRIADLLRFARNS
jgi:hypothetical protein